MIKVAKLEKFKNHLWNNSNDLFPCKDINITNVPKETHKCQEIPMLTSLEIESTLEQSFRSQYYQ